LKEKDVEKLKEKKQIKERDVKVKEGEVQKEEKRIEDLRNRIRSYFSIAASIVDPTKWRSLVAASAACVGQALYEEAATSITSDLQRLRDELESAQKELAKIEDELVLANIEVATMKWKNAKSEVERANQDFLAAVNQVRFEQTTLVEAMKKSSATAPAAAAIAKRGEIADASFEATGLIVKYLKETQPFIIWMRSVADRYGGYVDIIAKTSGNAPYLASLADIARENKDAILAFIEYMQVVRNEATNAGNYLAKNKNQWFAGYDQVPNAVRTAVIDRNNSSA
jgi:hypothetical protein